MKKYKITVNGQSYEVEVEELGGEPQTTDPIEPTKPTVEPKPVEKQQPAAAAPVPSPNPAPAPPKAATDTAGKTTITAPMPGTILSIKVKAGDEVAKGDVIMILEAMKMENEIFAPEGGTVSIEVAEGASVNTGDLLAVIQ